MGRGPVLNRVFEPVKIFAREMAIYRMQGLAETSVSPAAVPARNSHIGSGMYRDPLLTNIGPVNGRTQPVWEELGFRFGDKGTHTSRTIMLSEFSVLLGGCSPEATRADYVKAIVEDNCLGNRRS